MTASQRVIVPDEEKYQRLCEPHPDSAAATKALNAFHKAVQAAREKYHIRNCVTVCDVAFVTAKSPHTHVVIGHHTAGSSIRATALLASALSQDLDALRIGMEMAARDEEARRDDEGEAES